MTSETNILKKINGLNYSAEEILKKEDLTSQDNLETYQTSSEKAFSSPLARTAVGALTGAAATATALYLSGGMSTIQSGAIATTGAAVGAKYSDKVGMLVDKFRGAIDYVSNGFSLERLSVEDIKDILNKDPEGFFGGLIGGLDGDEKMIVQGLEEAIGHYEEQMIHTLNGNATGVSENSQATIYSLADVSNTSENNIFSEQKRLIMSKDGGNLREEFFDEVNAKTGQKSYFSTDVESELSTGDLDMIDSVARVAVANQYSKMSLPALHKPLSTPKELAKPKAPIALGETYQNRAQATPSQGFMNKLQITGNLTITHKNGNRHYPAEDRVPPTREKINMTHAL